MGDKISIIKILVIFISFLVSLKILEKTSIPEFCEKKFKLTGQLRVFIFYAVLYMLLMLITTFMEEYLSICDEIIKATEWIGLGSITGLWIKISENVPIKSKSWFE